MFVLSFPVSYCNSISIFCGSLWNTSVEDTEYLYLFRGAGELSALNIHANEFAYNESISTGEIVKKVESPIDKVQIFKDVIDKQSHDVKHLSVYIGDSVGDLLCLLEADVGIVVGSSESLRKLGSQFGVKFVPLFSGLVTKQKEVTETDSSMWKGLSGTIYTVSSWAEIHALVLGPA